ncbi:MAG: hypothetical protein JWP29_872, partial [Rhodoferax sp.]|nr:hypothetical protein [Rhodoferax sp.]
MLLAVAVLAGCASGLRTPAPVEDRSQDVRPPASTAVVQPARPPVA